MRETTFSVLRQILLDLGFTMRTNPKSICFDHAESQISFLYPPYRDEELVDLIYLVGARRILDERGFLPRERFEELVRKNPVAG